MTRLRAVLYEMDCDEELWESLSEDEQGEAEEAITLIELGIDDLVAALPE